MPRFRLQHFQRYALAVASTFAALALTLWVTPIRTGSPLLLFAVAVMISAGYGGTRAGILAVLLSTAAADYFTVPPVNTFRPAVPGDAIPLLLFTCVGLAITWVHALLRQARERSEKNERRLREAHQELVRANSLTTSILEGTSDAIAALDLQFRFITFNRAYERQFPHLFGAPVTVGASLLELLSVPEHRDTASEQWRRAMGGEQYTVTETLGDRTFEIAFNPLRSTTGAIVGASQVVRDITSRLQLEAQLRQSQKMEAVGQLAGGVAHDFNNLLTVITGYIEFALQEIADSDPIRSMLIEVAGAAERAAALTRQLLAFSRRQSIEPAVFSLNILVGQLEKMLHRIIGEDVALVLSLKPDLPLIEADPGQIEQVIMNLSTNARDAMPNGGRLVIETGVLEIPGSTDPAAIRNLAPGNYVRLTVSDTGEGIPRSIQPHIFEPFFTTKAAGKGTGLGLSTVYGIVGRIGGAVYVESQPGEGAKFTAVFPVTTSTPSTEVAAPTSSATGSETVLLAEDAALVREYIRSVLTKHGYVVLEAANGREALAIARAYTCTIHLLLTDIIMPEMGGPELAAELLSTCPGIRVLLMSGYADRSARGFPTLHKPFNQSTLLTKIRAVLEA